MIDKSSRITYSRVWLVYGGKSKTCNGTKQNEIETKRNGTKRNETKRNCFVFCFSIYLRVITNSRNCFISFRFVSLISKNTHTTFYIYFTISSHKLRSQGLVFRILYNFYLKIVPPRLVYRGWYF
jgi:hypothetical protein